MAGTAHCGIIRVIDGAAARNSLHRHQFAPENRNVYRGGFPLQPGDLTAKEGIVLGGDVAHGPALCRSFVEFRGLESGRAVAAGAPRMRPS